MAVAAVAAHSHGGNSNSPEDDTCGGPRLTQDSRSVSCIVSDAMKVEDSEAPTEPGDAQVANLESIWNGNKVNYRRLARYWIEVLIFVVIVLSIIHLGVCIDCDPNHTFMHCANGPQERFCSWVEHLICITFMLEVFWRVYKMGIAYFHDAWCLFDFGLAICGTIDIYILPWLESLDKGTGDTAGDTMLKGRLVTVLRVLKVLRILRVVKLMRMVKSLDMIMQGLVEALKGMIWVGLLLLLLVYCAAVMAMLLFRDGQGPPSTVAVGYSFDTVPQAVWAMFSVAMLAEWTGIVEPLVQATWWAAAFFVIYIFIASLGILNLIIGVITERTAAVQRDFEMRTTKQRLALRVKSLGEMTAMLYKDKKQMTYQDLLVFRKTTLPTLGDHMNELVGSLHLPKGWHLENCHEIFDKDSTGEVCRREFENGMYSFIHSSDSQGTFVVQRDIASMGRRLAKLQGGIDKLTQMSQQGHAEPPVASIPAIDAAISLPSSQIDRIIEELSSRMRKDFSARVPTGGNEQPTAPFIAHDVPSFAPQDRSGALNQEDLRRSCADAVAAAEAARIELRSAERLLAQLRLPGQEGGPMSVPVLDAPLPPQGQPPQRYQPAKQQRQRAPMPFGDSGASPMSAGAAGNTTQQRWETDSDSVVREVNLLWQEDDR